MKNEMWEAEKMFDVHVDANVTINVGFIPHPNANYRTSKSCKRCRSCDILEILKLKPDCKKNIRYFYQVVSRI